MNKISELLKEGERLRHIYDELTSCRPTFEMDKPDHPTVRLETDRHKRWGHDLIEVTTNRDTYKSYLCSCGIELSARRFGG